MKRCDLHDWEEVADGVFVCFACDEVHRGAQPPAAGCVLDDEFRACPQSERLGHRRDGGQNERSRKHGRAAAKGRTRLGMDPGE